MKGFISILLLLLNFCSYGQFGYDAWFNPIWKQSLTIQYSQVSGSSNLTNFPVLVSITETKLEQNIYSGGLVANSNGYDIGFYSDANCILPLNWGVEIYTPSTGNLIAWVKIPTVSYTANTVFYMAIGNQSLNTFQGHNTTGGNSGSEWNSNYVAVLHFPNGTTLSASDATINGNTGTIHSVTATTGEVDGCGSYNGSSTYITIPPSSTYQTNYTTIMAWAYCTSANSNNPRIIASGNPGEGTPYCGFYIGRLSSGGDLYYGFGCNTTGGYVPSSTVMSLNTATFVAATFNGTTEYLYKNGVQINSTSLSGTIDYCVSPTIIGWDPALESNAQWGGWIDEIEICNIAQSQSWIATEYNNQSSPSSFITTSSWYR